MSDLPGARVTGICEPLNVGAGNQNKQGILFTTESSLYSHECQESVRGIVIAIIIALLQKY